LFVNLFFLVLNIIFMVSGSSPTINFIASMFCLGGAVSAYLLYISAEE
jgi:hypothetical protein